MEYVVTGIRGTASGKNCHCVHFDDEGVIVQDAACKDGMKLCNKVEIQDGSITKISGTAQIDEIETIADVETEQMVLSGEYKTAIKELNDIVLRMRPALLSASRMLVKKLLLGAHIVIRFHNDADGSSGAYALYKAIDGLLSEKNLGSGRIRWAMHRGVTYDVTDAINDKSSAANTVCIEKPLLVIIDFGTSVMSNAGIKNISSEFDVIWLDHHPLEEGFEGKKLQFYLNPWQFGGTSDFTAGFLAIVLSKTLARTDTKEIENASFVGDYSKYADKNGPGSELATLLDLLTSDVRIAVGQQTRNLTPKDIDTVVMNKGRYDELLAYSKAKMSEAIDLALQHMKTYKAGDGNIYVVDFDAVRSEDTKYPLPGRFSSKLLDKLIERNKGKAVLLLYFGSFISIRVDKRVAESVNILGIIAELKNSHAEEIESGGGHGTAANIKLSQGYDRSDILRNLISAIKPGLAKSSA